ncbi:MAG: hypothetical protein M1831_002111 [Alyxoria varia]|nr:MAG: hypothetical protein M1831_002111 [Alyxoria varia]
MSTPTLDDLPYLSERDINLLYDIAKLAESSDEGDPFRALFAAYANVLKQNNISSQNDQTYFRFLRRMHDGTDESENLVDRFQTFLARLGIEVVFDDDDDIQGTPPEESRPSRRASFGSVEDSIQSRQLLEREAPRRPLVRSSSQNDVPSVTAAEAPNGPNTQPANTAASSNNRHARYGHLNRRGGLSARQNQSTTTYPQQITSEERSSTSQIPNGILANITNGSIPTKQRNSAEGFGPEEPRQLEIEQKTSPELVSNAKILLFHHIAARCLHIFHDWQRKSRVTQHRHQELARLAEARDVEVLKRQTFDQWSNALAEKRHARETKRFFERLEAGASKARDLFLLTKAFSHWAQYTSDEVARSSAARRHILHTKYFNAWRDITVVNELKVRRLGLKKFFAIWRRKTCNVVACSNTAGEFRGAHLVENAYRQWFWQFCDRRAPHWYFTRLRAKCLQRWRTVARSLAIRGAWSTDFGAMKLMQQILMTWALRSSSVQNDHVQAQEFWRKNLLSYVVENMSKEVELGPARARVVQSVNQRLMRSSFAVWNEKTRTCLEASKLSDLRCMRKAWTEWNDGLRVQSVTQSVDDRVLVQSLYKWVLAERFALSERMYDHRLKTRVFQSWTTATDGHCSSLGRATHITRRSRNQRAKGHALARWMDASRSLRQREDDAHAFRGFRLGTQMLQQWKAKQQDVSRLSEWASLAQFFVLASKSIKRWREAVVSTKKARRREAYAKVRRGAKFRLVRSCFEWWRASTRVILDTDQEARNLHHHRMLQIRVLTFYDWTERSLAMARASMQAGEYYRHRLQSYCLRNLVNHLQISQDSSQQALEFFSGHLEDNGSAALRRLNWQLFQVKRQSETAESLKERNRDKHFRKILRHWSERAIMQRENSNEVPSPRVSSLRPAASTGLLTQRGDRALGATQGAITGHSQSLTRPLPSFSAALQTPGYLRTPSRRNTTRGSVSRLPAPTTPSMSRITPFYSRLRAQYTDVENAASARESFAMRLVDNSRREEQEAIEGETLAEELEE